VLRGPRDACRLALIALLFAACTPREQPYAEQIASLRTEKDQFMRASSQSPVPPERRASFPPLNYFPIELEYRVPASLQVMPGDDVMEMPTSTGQRRRMRRTGHLEFTLKGKPLRLTAFVDVTEGEGDISRLFVPFGDLTNGLETYQGGRYLDLDRTATGIYDLDFNRAYHPFCLYNPTYDCPVPPPENRLKIPIRAGERLPTAK
jgi:uncharacterized protein (DUF1684 family)